MENLESFSWVEANIKVLKITNGDRWPDEWKQNKKIQKNAADYCFKTIQGQLNTNWFDETKITVNDPAGD